MSRNVARMAMVLVVLGFGLTLVADTHPLTDVSRGGNADKSRVLPYEPFTQCPTPACMAPCQLGAPPQVLCKSADGTTAETTYFCCCCGGGGGANSYRPL